MGTCELYFKKGHHQLAALSTLSPGAHSTVEEIDILRLSSLFIVGGCFSRNNFYPYIQLLKAVK